MEANLQVALPDTLKRELQQACDHVTERATETLPIAERNAWLLDIALDHLTLGRAAVYGAIV